MNAETATQIMAIIEEALAKIKDLREAQEDHDIKMEIADIESMIVDADCAALQARLAARKPRTNAEA